MTSALAPLVGSVFAATAVLWSAAGLTAEARLVRRASRLLDLADKVPRRDVRVQLREAATADARRALAMRRTGKELGRTVVLAITMTVIAIGLPYYIASDATQEVGWRVGFWVGMWALYIASAIASWALVILIQHRRSAHRDDE